MPEEAQLTIVELAAKHGQVIKLPKGKSLRVGRDPLLTAAHRAACVLNGWNAYERLTGELPRLADDVYLAAIEAAKNGEATEAATVKVEA